MSLAVSLACQPLLALLALHGPPRATVDVESFVPSDAAFVLRAASLDDLGRVINVFAEGFQGKGAKVDPLDMVKMLVKVDGPWELVDRTKPFLICTSPAVAGPPVLPTIVVHSSDAAKLAGDEELKKHGWMCRAEGDVVALKPGFEPTLAEKPSPLVRGLDAFDVVARVDFAAVKEAFGDQVDAALDKLEASSKQDESDKIAAGTASFLADGMRTLVESLETFEIHASQSGDETTLGFEAKVAEGSAMDGVGKKEKAPLADLARGIDPEAPISILALIDMQGFADHMRSFLELAGTSMPDEEKKQMLSSFDASGDIYPLMGPGFGGCVRFGASGMRASYCARPKDAKAFIEKSIESMRAGNSSLQIEGPASVEVDGVTLQQFRVKSVVHEDKGGDKGAEKGDDKSDAKSKKGSVESVFGADGMLLSYAERAGALLCAVGGDDQTLARDVARFKSKAPEDGAQRLVDAVAGMNPCFALQVDLGGFLEGVSGFAEHMGGAGAPESVLEVARELQGAAPLLISGGVAGRTWRLSIAGDAKRLLSLAQRNAKPAPKAKK